MSAGDAKKFLYKGQYPFVKNTTRRVILPVRLHVRLLLHADKETHHRLENTFKL
jgi:hypothetical protein